MNRASRYLVVEDDDDHATLIERNLQRAEPKSVVERLVDGAEAMQYLNREHPYSDRMRPDVVILDLKLPKLTGLDVLKKVKHDHTLSSIPVIMLTTSAAESDRVTAYQNHVNSYLVKPMEFTGFRELVNDICHYWGDLNCPVADRN